MGEIHLTMIVVQNHAPMGEIEEIRVAHRDTLVGVFQNEDHEAYSFAVRMFSSSCSLSRIRANVNSRSNHLPLLGLA